MASLRKAKKQAKKEGRVFIEPEKLKRRRLAKEVEKQVSLVNQRLRRLDKKGFYNSFSSKKLFVTISSASIKVINFPLAASIPTFLAWDTPIFSFNLNNLILLSLILSNIFKLLSVELSSTINNSKLV